MISLRENPASAGKVSGEVDIVLPHGRETFTPENEQGYREVMEPLLRKAEVSVSRNLTKERIVLDA